MKTKQIVLAAVIACGVALAGGQTANAQYGTGFGAGGNPFYLFNGFGFGGSPYGLGYIPVPPYFALHPPVYYGERYYRPYGESPFAAPSLLQVNERYRPEPRTDFVSPLSVVNPYCAAALGAKTPAGSTDGVGVAAHEAPLLIENPFYQRVADVAAPAGRLAKMD